jgi:hypothetical protein
MADRIAEITAELKALEGKYTEAKAVLSGPRRVQLAVDVLDRIRLLFTAFDVKSQSSPADAAFTLGQVREAMWAYDVPESVVRRYERLRENLQAILPPAVET